MEKIEVCVNDFISGILENEIENVKAILLIGSINREKKIIQDWSDLDFIIIWKNLQKLNFERLASTIERIESKYSLRIDLNQISEAELSDITYSQCLYNGIIMNAIKRPHQHQILFGSLPDFQITDQQEKQAALYYINQMLFWKREYFIETLFRTSNLKDNFPQLLRRTFSIVRASLRLFDIFCNPYEDTIENAENVFPEFKFEVLQKLHLIKNNYSSIEVCKLEETLIEISNFIETFIPLVLRKYNEKR